MDPISRINIEKDTSFSLLLEAQARSWDIYYMEVNDLFLLKDTPLATMRRLTVADNKADHYQFHETIVQALAELDVILMRKDPPFNMNYIYTTYLLELAQAQGVLVVNDPTALRNVNEKLSIAWFPQCTVDTVVCSKAEHILTFLDQHRDIILKPLDGMAGSSVFRVKHTDSNTNVIIETLTNNGNTPIMLQRYIPQVIEGDKRIIIIDGEPFQYALLRIPKAGEHRANLAAGGTAKGVELTEQDKWICQQLAPTLKSKGLLFVGIDVIGDYLTEINITSPTCTRELDNIYLTNIAGMIMDVITPRVSLQE